MACRLASTEPLFEPMHDSWAVTALLSVNKIITYLLTNAGILLTGPLGTNSSEILIEIHTVSWEKMHLKIPSGKWRSFFLGLNVLNNL